MGYNPFEVNQAAKKAAKLLGESGQVGRVEGKKYEVRIEPWRDGELFDFSTAEFYKVSDLTPTLAELDGATLEVQFEGEVMETTISADQFMKCNRDELYVHPDIGVCLATEDFENYDGAHVTAGLYMMYDVLDEGSAYVLIWGNETIHPIDPKFIPGAVLPVVEITTELPEDGTETALTEVESAKLEEANAMKMPCVIRCRTESLPEMSTLFAWGGNQFVTNFDAFTIGYMKTDNGWVGVALVMEG